MFSDRYSSNELSLNVHTIKLRCQVHTKYGVKCLPQLSLFFWEGHSLGCIHSILRCKGHSFMDVWFNHILEWKQKRVFCWKVY